MLDPKGGSKTVSHKSSCHSLSTYQTYTQSYRNV